MGKFVGRFWWEESQSEKRINPGAQGPIFVSWASSGIKKGRLKNSLPFPFAPQMRPI
jgi:hypothetical protein